MSTITCRPGKGYLVFDRPLDRVDDEHFDGSALRLELQPELLLNRGVKRWSFLRLFPRQVRVVSAGESRFVDDVPPADLREASGEVRAYRGGVELDVAGQGSDAAEQRAVRSRRPAAFDRLGHRSLTVGRRGVQLCAERVVG